MAMWSWSGSWVTCPLHFFNLLGRLKKVTGKYRQTRKQEPNRQGTTKKEILLSFVSSRICKESWDFSNKTCFQCNSYKLQLTWYMNCLISRVENDWNIGLGPRIKIRKPSNSQLRWMVSLNRRTHRQHQGKLSKILVLPNVVGQQRIYI